MKAKNYISTLCFAALIVSAIYGGVFVSSKATNETIIAGSDTNATETTDNNKSMEVLAVKSGSYSVTIPKSITLDTATQSGTYSVKVAGDLDPKTHVYVAPIDGIPDTIDAIDFYMAEETKSKENVIVSVDHKKYLWSYEDAQNEIESTDNALTASNMTAGTWKGVLNFGVNLLNMDGTHPLAPECTLANWNYTLDETNCIVTLNYYTGNETDVIVYGNYSLNGKIYETKLASNVENANGSEPYMFNRQAQSNCENIKTIQFSDIINTSNVTNMRGMFNGCSSLTSFDLSSFDTSNVSKLYRMFAYCNSLLSVDLSSFDTSKVTDMNYMFYSCTSLTSLDLSSFDTSNVTNMTSMFYACPKLKTIYVTSGKWVTSQATTTNMLNNCGTSSVTYK